MYSPVRVSILIESPWLTKSGTLSVAPVSTVQGFVAFVAVFPATPGSHSVTSRITLIGGSIANTSPGFLNPGTYFAPFVLEKIEDLSDPVFPESQAHRFSGCCPQAY